MRRRLLLVVEAANAVLQVAAVEVDDARRNVFVCPNLTMPLLQSQNCGPLCVHCYVLHQKRRQSGSTAVFSIPNISIRIIVIYPKWKFRANPRYKAISFFNSLIFYVV